VRDAKKERENEVGYLTEVQTLEGSAGKSPEDLLIEHQESYEGREAAVHELEDMKAHFVATGDQVNLEWIDYSLHDIEDPAEMARLSGARKSWTGSEPAPCVPSEGAPCLRSPGSSPLSPVPPSAAAQCTSPWSSSDLAHRRRRQRPRRPRLPSRWSRLLRSSYRRPTCAVTPLASAKRASGTRASLTSTEPARWIPPAREQAPQTEALTLDSSLGRATWP